MSRCSHSGKAAARRPVHSWPLMKWMQEMDVLLMEHLLVQELEPDECVLRDGLPEYHIIDGNQRFVQQGEVPAKRGGSFEGARQPFLACNKLWRWWPAKRWPGGSQ